jgi:hypothetical protein
MKVEKETLFFNFRPYDYRYLVIIVEQKDITVHLED